MSTRPRFMHVLTLGLAAMGFLASSSMLAQARVDILGGAPAGSSIRRTSRGQRVQITRGGGHSLPIKKHASISRPAGEAHITRKAAEAGAVQGQASESPVSRYQPAINGVIAFMFAAYACAVLSYACNAYRHAPPTPVRAPLSFAAPADPAPSLVVVLRSSNGVLTCPASSFTFDPGVLEVNGVACPVDFVFHNGFEQ